MKVTFTTRVISMSPCYDSSGPQDKAVLNLTASATEPFAFYKRVQFAEEAQKPLCVSARDAEPGPLET